MKRNIACLVAAGFGILSVGASAQTDCHAVIAGRVTEAETSEPIPYAELLVLETGQGTTTDEAGTFRLEGLCDDSTYTVHCIHIGCSHIAKSVRVHDLTLLDFELAHEALGLQEVVVRGTAAPVMNAQGTQSLTGLQLDAAKGQALGDALRKLPGVNTLTTGSTIVKPVIQGLHSNRILTLNNGVRQEGQQWGLEHAPEIDPYLADRLTVVTGANSVRYGADALGGVILVEPRALRSEHGVGGEVNLAAFSNGRSGAVSGMLEGKLRGKLPLAWRVQGTGRRGGSFRTPDYYLANTGIAEANYSAALGLQQGRWDSEVFFSQFFTKIGIYRGAHIGNLTDLLAAIERGRPLEEGSFSYELGRPQQRVAHYLLKAKVSYRTGEAGKLSVQYARQFNRREEFDAHRPFGNLPSNFNNPEMMFELTTHTLDAAWEHRPWHHLNGSLGAQWMHQRNTTDRGGLIPDFESQTAGVFWVERWRRYPLPLELEAGARYDVRRLQVSERGNEVIDKTLNFSNLSGMVGGIWHLGKHLAAKAHVGSAWRSPGVNELYSDGVHHGSASYERGRTDLVPEQGLNLQLTLEGTTGLRLGGLSPKENLAFKVTAFRNRITNFIYLRPLPEPVLTIRGAFPAFEYDQTDAVLTGFDASADWRLARWLGLSLAGSVLRADDVRNDQPLVFMPANRLRTGLAFFPKEGDDASLLKITMTNVARQGRVPAGVDYTEPPAGYTILDVEAGTSFSFGKKPTADHRPPTSVNLSVAVENLFNTSYRDYLNRLRYFSHEAGRNVSVRVKFSF